MPIEWADLYPSLPMPIEWADLYPSLPMPTYAYLYLPMPIKWADLYPTLVMSIKWTDLRIGLGISLACTRVPFPAEYHFRTFKAGETLSMLAGYRVYFSEQKNNYKSEH